MHIEKSFENYLQACDELQTGSLTIGSNQLLSSLVLPKYISEFILRYPRIHLNLVDDNSVVLETMANAGTLDLVLDNHPLNPEIFEQHILRKEQLLLAVPAHFECNQRTVALTHQDILNDRHYDDDVQPVELHPFESVPFVTMTKENDTRMRVDEILKKGGIKPRTILEIDRLATLYSFVEQGTAASIVSDTLVQHLQHTSENVLFYKLSAPQASRELYLSYKRNRYYSRAMQAFAELMEQFKKQ